MPILDVDIVVESGETLAEGLASRVADAAATVFGTPPGRTWVRLRSLPRANYAEDAGGPPAGTYPVFVQVLKATVPDDDALQTEASALTTAIAGAAARPAENVHVLYLPPAAGRMAFGGQLVRRTS